MLNVFTFYGETFAATRKELLLLRSENSISYLHAGISAASGYTAGHLFTSAGYAGYWMPPFIDNSTGFVSVNHLCTGISLEFNRTYSFTESIRTVDLMFKYR